MSQEKKLSQLRDDILDMGLVPMKHDVYGTLDGEHCLSCESRMIRSCQDWRGKNKGISIKSIKAEVSKSYISPIIITYRLSDVEFIFSDGATGTFSAKYSQWKHNKIFYDVDNIHLSINRDNKKISFPAVGDTYSHVRDFLDANLKEGKGLLIPVFDLYDKFGKHEPK